MGKRKRVAGHAVLAGFLILTLRVSTTVGAQSETAGQAEESSVAGCLHAAADASGFVLVADDKQRYEIQASENVELAPHANHRVEITGTVEKTEASLVLKAAALKMVASSCEV